MNNEELSRNTQVFIEAKSSFLSEKWLKNVNAVSNLKMC